MWAGRGLLLTGWTCMCAGRDMCWYQLASNLGRLWDQGLGGSRASAARKGAEKGPGAAARRLTGRGSSALFSPLLSPCFHSHPLASQLSLLSNASRCAAHVAARQPHKHAGQSTPPAAATKALLIHLPTCRPDTHKPRLGSSSSSCPCGWQPWGPCGRARSWASPPPAHHH